MRTSFKSQCIIYLSYNKITKNTMICLNNTYLISSKLWLKLKFVKKQNVYWICLKTWHYLASSADDHTEHSILWLIWNLRSIRQHLGMQLNRQVNKNIILMIIHIAQKRCLDIIYFKQYFNLSMGIS